MNKKNERLFSTGNMQELRDRIEELTGHLDWLGWSSDGVEAAKRENRELRSALTTALRQLESYYGERNSADIETNDDNESSAYKACKAVLEKSTLTPTGNNP